MSQEIRHDMHRDWGRRVAQARADLKLSQRRLAEIIDVDQSTISRLERGVLVPSDDLKWKIAGALGKRVDELFIYPAVRPPFPEAVGQ